MTQLTLGCDASWPVYRVYIMNTFLRLMENYQWWHMPYTPDHDSYRFSEMWHCHLCFEHFLHYSTQLTFVKWHATNTLKHVQRLTLGNIFVLASSQIVLTLRAVICSCKLASIWQNLCIYKYKKRHSLHLHNRVKL